MRLKSTLSDWVYKPGHYLKRLPMLILMPVEGCNCKCRMCDIWQKKPSEVMAFDHISQLMHEAHALKTRRLVLTGGEPLLHPQIGDIFELAQGLGMKITLLSSGLLVQKKAHLISAYVDELVVSLDGPEQCHNFIRNVPGAYQLTRSGILALTKRPRLIARHVIQKATFPYLAQTVLAAQDWAVDHISFLTVDTDSRAFNHETPHNELQLSWDECTELAARIEQIIHSHADFILETPEKLRAMVQYFRACLGRASFPGGACNAPWNSCVVEPDGRVHPCFFQRYPDSGADSLGLGAQLNRMEAIHFRKSLNVASDPNCQSCVCRLWTPWKNRFDV